MTDRLLFEPGMSRAGGEIEGNFNVVCRTSGPVEVSTGTVTVNDGSEQRAAAADSPTPRDRPRLPADRAFVVQFRGSRSAPLVEPSGRVEHLISGVAAEFASWPELHRFVARVLGGPAVRRGAPIDTSSAQERQR
jgi:hypothetical protein